MKKLSLCLVLAGSAAHAADYPEEYVKRPQVVTQGMVQLRGNLNINLSRGSSFDPVVLAPSVEYGVTDDLQLAVRHDNSLCFGESCKLYNDLRFEAKYLFVRHDTVSLSVFAGPGFARFSPEVLMRANVGLGFWALGGDQFALNASLALGLGLNKRSVDLGIATVNLNPDTLGLALQPSFNFTPQVVGFIDTGLYSTLQAFGDAWSIPFGIGAMYTHDKVLDLGGEFYFPNVIGANSSGTLDARVLQFLVRYRFETQR